MTMNAGMAPMAPMGRYILPQFEERTSYGMKRLDPYTKMFEDRIIFLGVQVDDASADDIIAQLIVLESQDPDRDILMYINSPGGSFTAMTAIYDTMQYIRPDIQTFVVGQAASAAAVLLGDLGAMVCSWGLEGKWEYGGGQKKPPGLPAVGLVFRALRFTRACLSSRRWGARTKSTQKKLLQHACPRM